MACPLHNGGIDRISSAAFECRRADPQKIEVHMPAGKGCLTGGEDVRTVPFQLFEIPARRKEKHTAVPEIAALRKEPLCGGLRGLLHKLLDAPDRLPEDRMDIFSADVPVTGLGARRHYTEQHQCSPARGWRRGKHGLPQPRSITHPMISWRDEHQNQNGKASCRERMCQDGLVTGVAVALK